MSKLQDDLNPDEAILSERVRAKKQGAVVSPRGCETEQINGGLETAATLWEKNNQRRRNHASVAYFTTASSTAALRISISMLLITRRLASKLPKILRNLPFRFSR